ncbi:hypothetical protein LJ707_17800 [Mucilaginibacter sp. UR6-1]|uniref:hypothetical protein n=1 Tax=Mucilaginibacter sp. UR6-1 TaxID=1435643 RepID=UPI001E4363CF|nr:hypothetical protein [Mucilaginibacter sp. UR6-1]MCC8410801.1 hypothetical protein [Mucilaginibacter sp. UR6-1]
MATLKINVVNPKAIKLLQDLAELNLITIQENADNGFQRILTKLRSNDKNAPNLDEITKQVEVVRKRRYEK